MDRALDLCATGSESGESTELVCNRFKESIERWTCVQQVQRVDRALNLYATGSESG